MGQSHSARQRGVLDLGVAVGGGGLDDLQGLGPAGRAQQSQQGELRLAPGLAIAPQIASMIAGGVEVPVKMSVSFSPTVLLAVTPLTL